MQINTLLLWFGPFLLLALAAFGLLRTLRTQSAPPVPEATKALSKDEEQRLAQLLGKTR
jgi:cytochrome c-type biogenesis protein CcmH/NrfF